MTSTIEEFRARVTAAPPKDLDEALLMLQADLPVLVKDKRGQAGNQPTKYADLVQANAVVLPRLNALGIIYKTKPTLRETEPRFGLAYELKHVPSGTLDDGVYPLALADNPQRMGSAISYARRYVLLCLTGVVAEDEDDDGQAPTGRYVQRQQQRARPAGEPAEGKPAATAQRRQQRPRQAAPPLPGEEDPDGPVGQDQHRKMHALWRDLGMGGDEWREQRLTATARILGLEQLDSSATLTRAQADKVIAAQQERKARLVELGGGEPS